MSFLAYYNSFLANVRNGGRAAGGGLKWRQASSMCKYGQKWPYLASIIIVHLLFSTVIWKRVSRIKSVNSGRSCSLARLCMLHGDRHFLGTDYAVKTSVKKSQKKFTSTIYSIQGTRLGKKK